MIKERQREGLTLAKQRGTYRGRKQALSAAIARTIGISRATLYKYLKREG